MFRDWMRQCWTKDFTALNESNQVFGKLGKTAQKLFMQYAMNMIRHALVSEFMAAEKEKLNEAEQGFVTKFGKALNTQKLELISAELNQAHYHLERNANVKVLFLDMSLSIGRIMTAV
jgi:DNA polymerase-3 subunit delta'